MTFDRESGTTDALLTDLYLDALLAGALLDAAGAGLSTDPGSHLDPAARQAADRLRRDLVRVHPSFRFEERLATRLAEAAVAMRVQFAAGGEGGSVVAFRAAGRPDLDGDLIPASSDAADLAEGDRPEPGVRPPSPGFASDVDASGRRVPTRPMLIGGALTSAALSIAGAAFVAWRLGRPGRASTPMARAARAVRDARLATIGSAAIGTVVGGRSRPRRFD
jgi:hypothetical protein